MDTAKIVTEMRQYKDYDKQRKKNRKLLARKKRSAKVRKSTAVSGS